MDQSTPSNSVIRSIHSGVDAIFGESLTYPDFVDAVLQILIDVAPVDAVAVFDFSQPEKPRVACEKNLHEITVDGFFSLDMDHLSLQVKTLNEKKPNVINDRSFPEAGLKRHSIVTFPILADGQPAQVIELLTLGRLEPEEVQHLIEILEITSQYLLRYFTDHALAKSSGVSEDQFWKRFDAFLLRLQKSLDLKQTISIAVNDGRTLVGADRVSIALKYGHRTRIHGVSGQEGVQHRANLVQAMARLAESAINIGQPVIYQGKIEDLPPVLEEPLADYLTQSRTRMVMLIPLREPAPDVDPEDEAYKKSQPEQKIIGCLIVEQATEVRPKQDVVRRTELLRDHVEIAIDNCHKHETIFLLPVWRLMGRTLRSFKGKRLWIATAIFSALIVIGLALALIQWDYRVEGEGQAMPVEQYQIFAPWEGDVVDIFVKSGQHVDEKQPLLRLESDDLDAERIATNSERLEKEKLVAALTTQRSEAVRRDNSEEFIRVSAELAKAVVELEGAIARLKKIDSRIEKLTIRAPAAGVVATFQIDLLLRNRPVSRGELLLEIMQPSGPWRLELQIPEYRMGHVLKALDESEEQTLPVEFILATAVEQSYEGTLSINDIATRSEESQEEGTILEAYIAINKDDLPTQNPGAAVTAKINCGPRPLFNVLFGDITEFLQKHLWF